MKVLGIIFIGLSVLAFVIFMIFTHSSPRQSDYHFTYTWPFVLLSFGVSAGAALLLADWNVRRHKKDHLS